MQRATVHLIDTNPLQRQALRIADHRLERHDHISDDGGVAPDRQIQHALDPRPHGSIRHTGLFLGLADRAVAGGLTGVQRPTG